MTGISVPHDLEIAADGDIWLSDSGNDQILLLSPDLKIKKELKGAPYNFNSVRYQDQLADGTLVVADKNTYTVKSISADGLLKPPLGTPGKPSKGPNGLRMPEGLEVFGGTLWISDFGNDRFEGFP